MAGWNATYGYYHGAACGCLFCKDAQREAEEESRRRPRVAEACQRLHEPDPVLNPTH